MAFVRSGIVTFRYPSTQVIGERQYFSHCQVQRFRNVLSQLEGAHRRLVLTRESLTQWRSQGQSSLKGYASLLEKLWKAGEVGTTEYLVQLRQALDTRVAGEALQGKAWLAWADWLSAAGRVQAWLGIRTAGAVQ